MNYIDCTKKDWKPTSRLGDWIPRPNVLGEESEQICYFSPWPHVVDGEKKTGIAVIVAKLPLETQLQRVMEKGEPYRATIKLNNYLNLEFCET